MVGVSSNDESALIISTDGLDDPLYALKLGLRYGLYGWAILTVVSLVIWWPWKGMPGLWGVLIGSAVGGGFVLITAVVTLASNKLSPAGQMGALMGSYLIKVVAVLAVVAVLRNMTFYDRGALAATIIGAIVLVLGGEVYGVMQAKATYTFIPEATVVPEEDAADRETGEA